MGYCKRVGVILGVFLVVMVLGVGWDVFLNRMEYVEGNVNVSKCKGRIALTFDDGPGAYTEELLDGLRSRGVKAGFFVVGENVLEHKDLILRMKKEGHLIGNHTYSHVMLTSVSKDRASLEVCKTNAILSDIIKDKVLWIRPPYGLWNRNTQCMENMTIVLWNVDPMDWSVQNTQKVVQHIEANVKDGSVILLHDIYKTSVRAALKVIDDLKKEGYEFVRVDEMARKEKKGFYVIQ